MLGLGQRKRFPWVILLGRAKGFHGLILVFFFSEMTVSLWLAFDPGKETINVSLRLVFFFFFRKGLKICLGYIVIVFWGEGIKKAPKAVSLR